jgi:glycosyltransferase involved in cell wall biosynthesis
LSTGRGQESANLCPTLAALPAPPPGKTGWPWTEATPQQATDLAEPISDLEPDRSWPRISIVTPSYNQGQFIEETIRSVLLQGYPNLEYIIIDGGSTDDSTAIIRKYEPWLSYWVSVPDLGQSHAINKGFARSSGEIMAWLNSDDVYLEGTLTKVANAFRTNRDVHLVHGDVVYTDENSARLPLGIYRSKETSLLTKLEYWRGWDLPQPAVFFKRELYLQLGELDQTFQYALDYDYFLRAAFHHRFYRLPDVLATYRLHEASKTGVGESQKVLFHAECRQAVRRYVKINTTLYWKWRLRYALRRPLGFYYQHRRTGRQVLKALLTRAARRRR